MRSLVHLNSIQVNERVETDKEILQELKNGQKEILNKVEEIDKRLIMVETRLESELPACKKALMKSKGRKKIKFGL